MEVADVYADLYQYKDPVNYNFKQGYYYENDILTQRIEDFHVCAEYVSQNTLRLIVKRLDDHDGWPQDLKVCIYYANHGTRTIVDIGPSAINEQHVLVHTEYPIQASIKPIKMLPTYRYMPCPKAIGVNCIEFNRIFDTDITVLPEDLYAIGLDTDKVYTYNEKNSHWYEILPQWRHIISVALSFTKVRKFYCIVCSNDGYLEDYDTELRVKPQRMLTDKDTLNPECYPVWHSKRYIACNSSPKNVPYVIDMIDRHAIHICELYNHYRSIGTCMKFEDKKNKIVFGGRCDRGQHNFTVRKDIQGCQRRYLVSDAVPKTNLDATDGWITMETMMTYKYILDIDGRAATWDATAWKLNSGSVLFKTDSRWRQWFYDDFKPWVHYIPVKDDFSDLDLQWAWCEAHQEECQQLIKNAKALFQKVYRFKNMVQHTIKLIEQIL